MAAQNPKHVGIIQPDCSIGQTCSAAAEGWAIAARSDAGQSSSGSIIAVIAGTVAADESPATPFAVTPAAKSADSLKTPTVESTILVKRHRAGRHPGGERKRHRACDDLLSHHNLLNV